MFGLDVLVQKGGGCRTEFFGRFGCQIPATAVGRAPIALFGVAVQVVGKAVGHNVALRNDGYVLGRVPTYFVQHQRVVRAAEYQCVDVGILSE